MPTEGPGRVTLRRTFILCCLWHKRCNILVQWFLDFISGGKTTMIFSRQVMQQNWLQIPHLIPASDWDNQRKDFLELQTFLSIDPSEHIRQPLYFLSIRNVINSLMLNRPPPGCNPQNRSSPALIQRIEEICLCVQQVIKSTTRFQEQF